jgi:cathepsin L
VASAELLKAHDEIRNGHARDFSAQELVSCVKNTKKCGGAGGCEGATVELAMDYVMNNGLRSTQDVPYRGATGACDINAAESRLSEIDADGRVLFTGHMAPKDVFIERHAERAGQALGLQGFYTIEKNKYEPLMRALIEVGPVAITVAASDWSSYDSGVFNQCNDPTLNHAVLLMGVGKAGQHNTYIVKNSWGRGWGENGYIRLLRTHNEETNCAEDHSPLEGVACEGGPAKVKVCGMCGILYDNVVATFRK